MLIAVLGGWFKMQLDLNHDYCQQIYICIIEELKSLIIRPSTRHLLLLYQKVFLLSYLLLALLGTETLFGCAKRMQGEVLREASNENSAPTSAALL